MAGTRRLRLIALTLGIISTAGCGSYGGDGSGGGAAVVSGGSPLAATLAWADASGPVASYRVFVSRNDGTFTAQEDVTSASATVTGVPGDRVRIQVAALDADGNMGPVSSPSAEILFTENGPMAGAATVASSTSAAGVPEARSSTSTSSGDGADASDAADTSKSDSLEFAADGSRPLLWEADAPSLALRLTSLRDGALHTDLAFQRPADDWWVAGTDDYDGDGLADVLWENAAGEIAVSSLAALVETVPLAPVVPVGELADGEVVASTGDFDGDGRTDLLVENEATGERSLWWMDGGGAEVDALGGLDVAASSLAASGDFDGDGRSDLLWRRANGTLAIRFMEGAVAVAGLDLAGGASLEPVGTGDVDGDGDDDLVYREAGSGAVGVLLMEGRGQPTAWGRSVAPGPGWELADVVDLDGDGRDELVWASASSWMASFQAPEGDQELLPLAPGSGWLLVSFAP